MKKFYNNCWPKWAYLFSFVFFIAVAVFSLRVFDRAKWNSYALRYMGHTLGNNHNPKLSSSIPAGYDRAYMWWAREALVDGNIQKAFNLIESITTKDDPLALYLKAIAMEQQGNLDDALDAFIRLQNYELLITFGYKASRAGKQEVALNAFEAAWKIAPEKGVMSLVQHLRKQNRFDEAERLAQSALIENPNNGAIRIELGWIYYQRDNNLQAAINQFQKVISIDEARGDGYFAIAQVLTREQRFSDADNWYRRALERNSSYIGWYLARGNNARANENLEMALSIYQEAARLFPDESAVYYQIARTYAMEKQLEHARENIEKALALMGPPNEWYYLKAGQIYEMCSEESQALDAYQNALSINPDNEKAQEGLIRLTNP
jgi:tetratricopeptide (TPR) repeat protein